MTGTVARLPLLPRSLTWWAALTVAAAAAVVAVLGTRFAGHTQPSRLDTALDTRLAFRLSGHPGLLDRFVSLGAPSTVVAVTLVLTVAMALLRPGRAIVFVAVTPALASGLTELVLKPLIGRMKGAGLAFPSGHTTGAFSLAFVIAVVLLQPGHPRIPALIRVVLGLAAVTIAGGTATALVALRYHYATDTIGGVAVALGVTLAVALILDALCRRRPLGRSTEPVRRRAA